MSKQIGIWCWDQLNDALSWDQNMHDMFDHQPEEFTSKLRDFTDRLHPEDRDRVVAEVNKSIETGAQYDVEYRVILKDGTVSYVRAWGSAFNKPGRKELIGACENITSKNEFINKLKELKSGG